MCGINGFNFSDREQLRKMNRAIKHRGPDGEGEYIGKSISLGHHRLSIIDVSDAASQPMTTPDGRYTLVFNGEIYNFKELKSTLASNYTFKTQGDSEVVLAAYKEWGSDCIKHFNGIFAFAVWDAYKEKLFLARDHMGVKPLYYFWDNQRLIFSSEIKAILEHAIPRVLNKEALALYFRVLYVPEPHTLFSDIYKLPPAHSASLINGKLEVTRYWKPKETASNAFEKVSESELLYSTLHNAVERQLVSDRPIGLYLSGGIDSSALLHLATEIHGGMDTFSVGFEVDNEIDAEKFNRDSILAQRTATYYGAKHHEVYMSADEIMPLFEDALWHLDEPIANATALAQLKLSRFAKHHVDVVLGGDGGDELFGGYERYRLAHVSRLYRSLLPTYLQDILSVNSKAAKLSTTAGLEQFKLFMFQKDDVVEKILSPEVMNSIDSSFFSKYFEEPELVDEIQLMHADEQSWLVDEALMRTDKLSMASGLEARVPFLDREVVDVAHGVSANRYTSPFNTKIALKEALKGKIPEFLFTEPKRGWFSPGAKWLRNEAVYRYAKEVLSPEYYADTSALFNWTEVHALLEDHYHRRKYGYTMLWTLLSFQVWARRYGLHIEK